MYDAALEQLSQHLAENLRALRVLRGLTQQQLADLSEVPRSTVANLEIGGSNPTLAVLSRLAGALHLSIEELLARPRGRCQVFAPGALESVTSRRGGARLTKLLPQPIPGMAIDRMEFPAGARIPGAPHAPGTHEFLYCERGQLVLVVAGERHALERGAVAAFPGDQRHSYENPGKSPAVGFSVVSLAPVEAILAPGKPPTGGR